MSNSKKPMRVRAMTVAGGIALIGATGAGFADSANAATTSSASSTLAKIKACESGGNYQATNSSSGASGAYQFLNSTWRSLSASAGYATAASAPAPVQDAAAVELYNAQGTSPWASSSGCWSSMTSASTSGSSTSASSAASTTASTSATSTGSTARTIGSTTAKGTHRAPQAASKTGDGRHHAKPAAAKPHGKAANKRLPKVGGGKHHAKPATAKPVKRDANKHVHKPGTHRQAPAKAAA